MKKIAKRVAVVSGSVLAALLVVEVGLRLWGTNLAALRDSVLPVDDPRGFVIRPSLRVAFYGLYDRIPGGVTWESNADGFRADRSATATPAPGDYRIATFGDSAAFGWSVNLAATFEEQMERRVPGLEVLNFGVPGYNAANVAEHVKRNLPRFDADLALYVVHPNDLDDPISYDGGAMDSELYRRMVYLARWTPAVTERAQPVRVAGFLDAVHDIVTTCRERGVPLVLVFLAESVRDLVAADARFAQEQNPGLRCVDASRVYANAGKIDHHMDAAAHQALAEFLLQALGPWPRSGRAHR